MGCGILRLARSSSHAPDRSQAESTPVQPGASRAGQAVLTQGAEGPPADAGSGPWPLLQSAERVGALLLAFTPGVGVLVRWIALSSHPNVNPAFEIALAAPLGVLIVVGLLALFPAFAPYVFTLGVRLRRRKPRLSRRFARRLALGLILSSLVPFILFFLFYPRAWIVVLLAAPPSAWAAVKTARLSETARVSYTRLLPLAAILALSGVVTSSLGQIYFFSAYYQFRPSTMLASGAYLSLGDTSQVRYLLSCENTDGPVTAVDLETIESATYDTEVADGPSLWEILTEGQPVELGALLLCGSTRGSPTQSGPSMP